MALTADRLSAEPVQTQIQLIQFELKISLLLSSRPLTGLSFVPWKSVRTIFFIPLDHPVAGDFMKLVVMITAYRIGEFSLVTGLSGKTLRFYHERGVQLPIAG